MVRGVQDGREIDFGPVPKGFFGRVQHIQLFKFFGDINLDSQVLFGKRGVLGMLVPHEFFVEHGISQKNVDDLLAAEDVRNEPCFTNAPADEASQKQCQLFSDLDRSLHRGNGSVKAQE